MSSTGSNHQSTIQRSVPSESRGGRLVVCPTPLGNLGDVTDRTRAALSSCDVVCCEDTRVTGRLLAALGIEKRLERLDEATIGSRSAQLVKRVMAGETIAYASDAGMPGVSDPGQRLVDACLDAGATVEVLPGGTAVTTAYVASGFPTQNFYFGAFFPRKMGERVRLLETLRNLPAALVFYESPLRLVSALTTIAEVFPYRRVAVCRELTKLHEEVVRGISSEVLAVFQNRQAEAGIKGELVLVIENANDDEAAAFELNRVDDAQVRAQELLATGDATRKDVIRAIRTEFGLSRNDAYELVLSLTKD